MNSIFLNKSKENVGRIKARDTFWIDLKSQLMRQKSGHIHAILSVDNVASFFFFIMSKFLSILIIISDN